MTLVCEDLATKAELQELKDQINTLLGETEQGNSIDVLGAGTLAGTLLLGSMQLAQNSVQDIVLENASGSLINNIDPAIVKDLANGNAKWMKVKGTTNIRTPLQVMTNTAKNSSTALIQTTGTAGAAAASAAVMQSSIALVTALASIITSLGLNIVTVNVLGGRIDELEKALLQGNTDFENLINLISKNKENYTQAANELLSAQQKISEQEVETLAIKDELGTANDNVSDLTEKLSEAETTIDELTSQQSVLTDYVNNLEGELTQEVQALSDGLAQTTDNLNIAKNQITNLTTTAQDLGTSLANLEGRSDVMQDQLQKAATKATQNYIEIQTLKQEIQINQVVTNSKLKTLESKLILAQNSVKTGGGTGGFSSDAKSSDAETQTKVLELANKLAGNAPDSQTTTITAQEVGTGNPFQSKFDSLIPQIQPQPAEITEVQLTDLETSILTGITTYFNDTGFNNVPNRLTGLETNTTPEAQQTNVREGICQSLQPGNCMQEQLYQPLRNQGIDALNGINNNAGILSGINTFLNNNILSKLDGIRGVVDANFGLLSHAQHGLQATKEFLEKAWETTRAGKILQAISVACSIHNAAMLSRNLGASLGDMLSLIANNTLSFITNEEQNPININETLGNTVEGFLKGLLGEDNYEDITDTYKKYNRIIQTASNIVWTLQGIQMGLAYGLETVGNYTGKIGNALKKSGAVLENSYNYMNEQMNFRSGRLGTLNNVINQTQDIENVVSEVAQVTSEFREIQEQTNYFNQQVGDLTEQLDLKTTEKSQELLTEKSNSQGSQPVQSDFTPDPVGE